LLRLTTDGHKASRGLSATAATFLRLQAAAYDGVEPRRRMTLLYIILQGDQKVRWTCSRKKN